MVMVKSRFASRDLKTIAPKNLKTKRLSRCQTMDAASVKKISHASSIHSLPQGPAERDLDFPPCAALHGRMAVMWRFNRNWARALRSRFTCRLHLKAEANCLTSKQIS